MIVVVFNIQWRFQWLFFSSSSKDVVFPAGNKKKEKNELAFRSVTLFSFPFALFPREKKTGIHFQWQRFFLLRVKKKRESVRDWKRKICLCGFFSREERREKTNLCGSLVCASFVSALNERALIKVLKTRLKSFIIHVKRRRKKDHRICNSCPLFHFWAPPPLRGPTELKQLSAFNSLSSV